MSDDYYLKGSENVFYHCLRCGADMTDNDLAMRGGAIKCVICGYKVLRKLRPPVVKRIRAI